MSEQICIRVLSGASNLCNFLGLLPVKFVKLRRVIPTTKRYLAPQTVFCYLAYIQSCVFSLLEIKFCYESTDKLINLDTDMFLSLIFNMYLLVYKLSGLSYGISLHRHDADFAQLWNEVLAHETLNRATISKSSKHFTGSIAAMDGLRKKNKKILKIVCGLEIALGISTSLIFTVIALFKPCKFSKICYLNSSVFFAVLNYSTELFAMFVAGLSTVPGLMCCLLPLHCLFWDLEILRYKVHRTLKQTFSSCFIEYK